MYRCTSLPGQNARNDDPYGKNRLKCELERHASLFDTIERSPLTYEQRVAAVTMARRNLLVAAAGSGKTSSIVGKVAYAICSGMCTAEQILVLAFNRKAAIELDGRLSNCLAPYLPSGCSVEACTLHALGLDIVTQSSGRRPHVLNAQDSMLDKVLVRLVHHHAEFAEHWLLFRVFYHVPVRHPDQFRSYRQWKAFVCQHGESRRRRRGFLTLRDELVPTQFEQAVANFLYLYGIDYVYTSYIRKFSMPILWPGTLCARPLAGRAGFFLKGFNRYIVCTDSQSPARHADDVICVNLDAFRAGTVFRGLKESLGLAGAVPEHGRMAMLLNGLGHRLTPGQTEFLMRFIRMARLRGLAPEEIAEHVSRCPDPAHQSLYVPMLVQLLSAWQTALDDAATIDFEGMLHDAADALDSGRYRHAYTLILVDEFQDTSWGGVRLLKSLLAQNTDCKLFAVGDDWQSIYRFAGAVPDILGSFEKHFGTATVNRLTATFRFNQVIADVATSFAQVNPAQMRKHVRARQAGAGPSIVLARYITPSHMFSLCELCLNDIVATPLSGPESPGQNGGTPASVYILGRYQHQQPPGLKRWQQAMPQLDIQYQTVHSAKGLEADVVIVLGLEAGRHGFPAEVPDDALMSLVLPDLERFPHAEERRLFYVALTRCRHRVYLLAGLQRPSPFVTELLEHHADTLCCSSFDH